MSARLPLTEEERGMLRAQIMRRDGKRCFYCRRNFKRRWSRRKTFDHYVPYSLWPTWEVSNLVLACQACNLAKANALPWPLVWLLTAAPSVYVTAA